MTKGLNKLQLKLTIEFAFFFIIASSFIYFYFVNSFENDAQEKFNYKARMISNYLVQNPLLLQEQKFYERDQLTKLMEINDAKYLMLEDINGRVLDAINIDQDKTKYYLNTRAAGGISTEENLIRIQLPFIANKMEIGKLFVGFRGVQ